MPNGNGQQTCFVVMGFGEKTDFQSNPQRVLDLNRTYEDIIEPAVTDSGVQCIRADKIIHSTVIDKPMYDNLLSADLVIADLSTSNANALYELGVRHALRPHATIVIAEQKFAFPFDLNHLLIERYEHLGKEIGFREVMRMRQVLKDKIAVILKAQETDSPVFMFLPQLLPMPKPMTTITGMPGIRALEVAAPPAPAAMAERLDDKSFGELMELFKKTRQKGKKQSSDWLEVLEVLDRIQKLQPNDPYVIQQRALATYSSESPDALTSLNAARDIMEPLKPDTSAEAETVGLWGAIHKRLWYATKDPGALDKAIRSYARGYFLKDDYYNGINFAFLLNVRAAESHGDEALADRVLARRIRKETLTLCDVALLAENLTIDDKFWINATKVEALLGMNETTASATLRQSIIKNLDPDDWRIKTMDKQLKRLADLKP